MAIEEQANICLRVKERLPDARFYAAVGANGETEARALALMDAGVANGHNSLCIQTVSYIKEKWPRINIVAGNVCTYGGARDLWQLGLNTLILLRNIF